MLFSGAGGEVLALCLLEGDEAQIGVLVFLVTVKSGPKGLVVLGVEGGLIGVSSHDGKRV